MEDDYDKFGISKNPYVNIKYPKLKTPCSFILILCLIP